MIVVTSGSMYLDIDSYAGIVAYAELLNLQGIKAVAASSVSINHSVTEELFRPDVDLKEYKPKTGDKFVLVDLSTVKFFDSFVELDSVVEIIDHHPGHEEFWQEKIGDKAHIEVIGAACTLVYERFMQAGKLEQMLPATAKGLAAGILDNTLNFTAGVTKDRDHIAYKSLVDIARLGDDFPAQYFSEVQQAIENDIENAIKNDIKTIVETDLVPKHLGQLVVWDGKSIVGNDINRIVKVIQHYGDDWGVNVVSISEQKSYFVATNPISQQKFTDLCSVKFENGVSEPHKSILRKEILKIALNKTM